MSLPRLLSALTGSQLIMLVIWLGLASFTVGLIVLLWTRWGQYRPLSKCLILSLLGHLVLGLYATTVKVTLPAEGHDELIARVSLEDGDGGGPISPEQSADDPPYHAPAAEAGSPGDSSDAELPRLGDTHDPAPPIAGPPPHPPTHLPEPAAAVEATLASAQRPHPATTPAPGLQVDTPMQRTAPTVEEPITAPSIEEPSPPQTADPAELARQPSLAAGTHEEAGRLSPPVLPTAPPSGATSPATPTPAGPVPYDLVGKVNLPRPATLPSAAGGDRGVPDGTPSGSGTGGNTARAQPLAPDLAARAAEDPYQLRPAPNRAPSGERRGGTPATENAVRAALKWLADAQSADGRWVAADFGAGREDLVLGENRHNAGKNADAGVTGLALLSFLGAGHTHKQGEYRETVRKGLNYLLRIQATDGNVAGDADVYARLYSHGMATLALSEALGMTRDEQLREPVRKAVNFTLAMQNQTTGGWRYQQGDTGDTSQLGWQWMCIKSAEFTGFQIPDRVKPNIVKYLRTVSSGKAGGYASYRPGESPSRTMTAEALYCWQLLGLPREHPAVAEAADYIVGELPGTRKHNCYFWYYATLALYQLQDDRWDRWNAALRQTLVERQVKDGPLAGSWDNDTVWGGYGGRVYTTAISALTLEVYYRYLPLYGEQSKAR